MHHTISSEQTAQFLNEYEAIQAYYHLRSTQDNGDPLLNEFFSNGFAVVHDFITPSKAAEWLEAIPQRSEMEIDVESFSAANVHNAIEVLGFKEFYDHPTLNAHARAIIGPDVVRHRTTAERREITGFTGAFDEFFHFDTFRHRVKAFLYLSDVDGDNGPLTIVPRSATGLWRIQEALEHFSLMQLGDDSYVHDGDKQYLSTLFPHQATKVFRDLATAPVEIHGKAGTMIFWDGRMLHRVKPSVLGKRVSLSTVWVQQGKPI